MSKLIFLGLSGLGMWGAWSATTAVGPRTAITIVSELPGLSFLIIPALVIILLVVVNGLFVAAEFAIISVRPTQIEPLADEGSETARNVLHILDSRQAQDKYIATAQLGITIASLGLAMYGEPAIAHFIEAYVGHWFTLSETVLHSMGYIIALSILTYLHIVIGEMVPKTLALSDSVQMVLWLTKPMQWAQKILGLPVQMLNAIGIKLLQLFQVPPAEGHARVLSPEELELIVTESAEGGLLKAQEEVMIRNIFDFGERLVGQVMTPRTKVQAIHHAIDRDTLLKLVTESRHSRFPVYETDRDHIIGILHIKDLARQAIKPQSRFDLRLILRMAPAIPEDLPVEELLGIFKRQRLHMAIVLDEFGGMAGIVTLEDLVEQIVGEVRDEFDLEKEPYIELEPGVIEVAGEYLVDDLKEVVYLGKDEELPDVETVGGLIITRLGRPPVVGDEVSYNKVCLTVLVVAHRAVLRAMVKYSDPNALEKPDASEM